MMRNSFKYIPQKQRTEFINDLKTVYTALNEAEAHFALNTLIEKWTGRYPLATKPWFDHQCLQMMTRSLKLFPSNALHHANNL